MGDGKSIEGSMAVLLATEALRARLASSKAEAAVRVVVPEFFDFRRQFGLAVELKDGKRHAVKAETIGLAFMALTEWVEFYLEGVGDVGRETAADRTGDRAEAVRDGG